MTTGERERARKSDAAPGELEARLERLAAELRELRSRLEALERHAGLAEPAAEARASTAGRPADERGAANLLALAGRTLVALGGAYLVRAATDAGALPPVLGIAAGLGYAALFLFLTDRAASRNRTPSAVCHAVSAMAISHPLLWETTVRFGLLRAPGAAALLVVFLAAGWIVAVRWKLALVATVVTLATLVTSLALLLQARDFTAFTPVLLVVAGIAEAASMGGLWPGLRWPAALGVDLAAWALVEVAARPGGLPESWAPLRPETATALLLLLPVLYLSTLCGRLLRGCGLSGFDVVQTVIAVPLGLSGAVRVLENAGQTPLVVGLLVTALGGAAYTLLVLLRSRLGSVTISFVGGVGLILVLAGTHLLTAGAARAALWSLLALGASVAARRVGAARLDLHASAYLLAAAEAGGLLHHALVALLAPPAAVGSAWPGIHAGIVVAVAMVSYAVLARQGAGAARLLARTLIAALLSLVAAGLMVDGALSTLGGTPDAGALAAVRTLVLAGLAALLAILARSPKVQELSLLSYAALALGGLKLVIEDLPSGRPATLFLALTAYGVALLAVARLTRPRSAIGTLSSRGPG